MRQLYPTRNSSFPSQKSTGGDRQEKHIRQNLNSGLGLLALSRAELYALLFSQSAVLTSTLHVANG